MSGNVRELRPGGAVLVELGDFDSDPKLYDQWNGRLRRDRQIFSRWHWRFMEDPQAKAAAAVSRLLFGITYAYPEFQSLNIGTMSTHGKFHSGPVTRNVGYLALTIPRETRVLDAERTVTGLVGATNAELLALNSPYRLPLELPVS